MEELNPEQDIAFEPEENNTLDHAERDGYSTHDGNDGRYTPIADLDGYVIDRVKRHNAGHEKHINVGDTLYFARTVLDSPNSEERGRLANLQLSPNQARDIAAWGWDVWYDYARVLYQQGKTLVARELISDVPPSMARVAKLVGDTPSHVSRDIHKGFQRYGFFTLEEGRLALKNGLLVAADKVEQERHFRAMLWREGYEPARRTVDEHHPLGYRRPKIG